MTPPTPDANSAWGLIVTAAPPVSVSGLSLAGVTLSDWVLLATLVYTLLQTGWFINSKFIKGRER